MNNFPPKFSLTPRGAAGLFLRARCPYAGPDDLEVLTQVLEEAWLEGYIHGRRGVALTDETPQGVRERVARALGEAG